MLLTRNSGCKGMLFILINKELACIFATDIIKILFKICLKAFFIASSEFLFGLFSFWVGRNSPTMLLLKQKNIFKNNPQKKAEQNLNRLLKKRG